MIGPVRGNRCPEKASGLGTDSQQVMLRHPPRSHPSDVQVLTSCGLAVPALLHTVSSTFSIPC